MKTWIEMIFPERYDHKIVRLLDESAWLRHVRPSNNKDFISLLSFTEPEVRAVIHEAKFQHNEKAWRLLALALSSYMKHCDPETLILPIPLSTKRQKKRGYNQVVKVVRHEKSGVRGANVREDILYRVRDTTPQTKLKRAERLKNMVGAFGAHHVLPLENRHIIILDDVATTGATMMAARASLAPHKPLSITLLALAH